MFLFLYIIYTLSIYQKKQIIFPLDRGKIIIADYASHPTQEIFLESSCAADFECW